ARRSSSVEQDDVAGEEELGRRVLRGRGSFERLARAEVETREETRVAARDGEDADRTRAAQPNADAVEDDGSGTAHLDRALAERELEASEHEAREFAHPVVEVDVPSDGDLPGERLGGPPRGRDTDRAVSVRPAHGDERDDAPFDDGAFD